MKKLFTLLIAGMFMLPAMAQYPVTNGNMAGKLKQDRKHTTRNFASTRAEKSMPAALKIKSLQSHQQKNALAIFQQMDSYVYQEYDAAGSQWINSEMDEFSYDAFGNNTMDIYSNWNEDTEEWETEGKQEFIYNNGVLTEQIFSEWDWDMSTWFPYVKWTYNYDGTGNMILAYYYYIDDPDWALAGKDERTYDPAGNMLTQINSFWDDSSSEWFYSDKLENAYNGSGNLLVSTSFSWDFISEDWVNDYKDEYIYNGLGQQTSEVSYSWSSGINQWVEDFKYDYIWDGNMNLVQVLEQEWNGSQWVSYYKTELTYNNAYTGSELILPWYFSEEADLIMHMITGGIGYDYIGGSYVMEGNFIYNYSPVTITGISDPVVAQASIYPQPSNGQVTFTWETNNPTFNLGIYDMNGRLVMTKQVENNQSVAVDRLTPGLYFYRLTGNNQQMLSGKISIR